MKTLFFITLIALMACSRGGSGAGGVQPPKADTTFTNPLLSSGPDPWVLQKDGYYYFMRTLGNRLAISKTQY
ncbi:MAG: glycosyl hydrolase family 43, partial [Niastella sp.]